MESILTLSVTQNASDLHLSSHEKVMMRQNGRLIKIDLMLSDRELTEKLFSLLSDKQRKVFEEHKQIDFAYAHCLLGRFRVNIFYQHKGIAAVFRVIKDIIPALDDIAAPAIFKNLILKQQGLILITGATGSGKSTTLASMIQHVNHHEQKHIITLEDPIEFIYQNEQSLIHQREMAAHCRTFSSGLRAALRQDPDIIMIGELRDKETIEIALQAAETGHLVLATLHTSSAVQTINRIIDLFPDESKSFIRSQLSSSLQAVISQTLIADTGQTRKAIFDVLINTPAVSNLIQEGKIKQLVSVMQTGQKFGMSYHCSY